MRYRKKRDNYFWTFSIWCMIFMSVCMIVGLSDGMRQAEETVHSTNEMKKENHQQLITEAANENKKKTEQIDEDLAEEKQIRVLLMSTSYKSIAHPTVIVSASSGLKVSFGEKSKDYGKKVKLEIKPDDEWFQQGNVYIKAKKEKIKIHNIKRGDGIPDYAGILELRKTQEGIVIINELSVEEYLYGVVPSEMPASYEAEALKAQAVCARSYAYRQMKNYAYKEYKAHVNDSTDYQVYNNSAQAKKSTQAVKDTKGLVVWYQGNIASTYYYSTSCGKTTTTEAWGEQKTKSNGYLESVEVKGKHGDYEKELPWYRWKIKISKHHLGSLVSQNIGKQLGDINKIKITKKGPGGVVCEITIKGEKDTATIETENEIRKAFGSTEYKIIRNDGSKVTGRAMLPSGFFQVKKEGNDFIFNGGGFGHGIGMSQTGANEMAKEGKDYQDILQLFYKNIKIEKIKF